MCRPGSLGFSSVTISILSVPLSLVSGLGIYLALLALFVASVALLAGELKYSIATLMISTISIFFLSVLDDILFPKYGLYFQIMIPYCVWFACFLVRLNKR